jgi:hypothetical protein
MTEAAIVRGASVVASSSIVRSPGDWDMLAGKAGWSRKAFYEGDGEGVGRLRARMERYCEGLIYEQTM